WLGSRAVKFERAWLAAFLVGMPLVYVLGWFVARDRAASSWIWVELLGLALFAAFAALGLKKSPWFLAIGIAGHGLAWDSWHQRNAKSWCRCMRPQSTIGIGRCSSGRCFRSDSTSHVFGFWVPTSRDGLLPSAAGFNVLRSETRSTVICLASALAAGADLRSM